MRYPNPYFREGMWDKLLFIVKETGVKSPSSWINEQIAREYKKVLRKKIAEA